MRPVDLNPLHVSEFSDKALITQGYLDDFIDQELFGEGPEHNFADRVLLLQGPKDPFVEQGLFLHPFAKVDAHDPQVDDDAADVDSSVLNMDDSLKGYDALRRDVRAGSCPAPESKTRDGCPPAPFAEEELDDLSDLDSWMTGMNTRGQFFGAAKVHPLKKDPNARRRVRLPCIQNRRAADPCQVVVALSESRKTGMWSVNDTLKRPCMEHAEKDKVDIAGFGFGARPWRQFGPMTVCHELCEKNGNKPDFGQ